MFLYNYTFEYHDTGDPSESASLVDERPVQCPLYAFKRLAPKSIGGERFKELSLITFLKFLYTELIMGLSDVIRPLSIRDIMLPRVTMPITDLERKENRNGMAYLLRWTPVLKGVDLVNIALTKRTSASWSLQWLT